MGIVRGKPISNNDGNGHPVVKPEVANAEPKPDPFDVNRLKLPQDFAAGLGVEKALLTVPVKKPAREWFVKVHPDPAFRVETAVLELKEDSHEIYLVAPELWPSLATESTFSPRTLFTTQNTQGVTFLWPVKLPGTDSRMDNWSRSSMEAAIMAIDKWVRLQANLSLGAYEVTIAKTEKEPAWPNKSFQELIRIAFKDRMIDDPFHPVLRQLRGEL
jgi:hypothetical protein